MINNISLIIHGPYDGHQLNEIKKRIDSFTMNFNQIIIVSYVDDYCDYKKDLDICFSGLNYQIILTKDLLNPGFANINRQVTQMQQGLAAAKDGNFIIKLRNDQNVDFNKLFSLIDKYKLFTKNEKKILTTNCFSRKDRLYHPSDMFMCAFKFVMVEYFNYPLMQKTETQCKMEVYEMFAKNPEMTFNPISPESELFRNFLKNNKWKLLETKKDSAEAFHKYVYLFNSWDIDFRWKKKRNWPFEHENEIILPHYFTLAPFVGAPEEIHRCWLRHEIMGGYINLIDYKYIKLAKKASKGIECGYTPSLVAKFFVNIIPFKGIRKHFKKKWKGYK